jgi:hypothetical protein
MKYGRLEGNAACTLIIRMTYTILIGKRERIGPCGGQTCNGWVGTIEDVHETGGVG